MLGIFFALQLMKISLYRYINSNYKEGLKSWFISSQARLNIIPNYKIITKESIQFPLHRKRKIIVTPLI